MRYTPTLLASSALSLGLLGCGGEVDNDSEGVDAEPTAPAGTPGPNSEPGVVPGAGGTPGVVPPQEPAVVAPGVVPPAAPVPTPPGAEPPLPVPEPTMTATPEPPAPAMESLLGTGVMGGSGMSSDRYAKADVTRDGQNYFFMANGWGPGFISQSVTWNGTSFTIVNMEGEAGESPNYEPATYPTVFCGKYSSETSKECGLPAPLSSITSIRTGWRWAPNGNTGQYNAAYDIWMGKDDGSFGGFVMVWLREPVGRQPAGSMVETSVTVENVPGTWHIWSGVVYDTVPIVNWVRKTGQDSTELEFDVMDFIRDAQARGYELPGTTIQAVAVGFEIWEGPVSNLESQDFYIDVQ